MTLFKRKQKGTIDQTVNVDEVYVITSMIISSHDDGKGFGPLCVNMYFLAKSKNNEYYELYSGKKLDKEPESKSGVSCKTFDTPYIQKAEPLKDYLKDPSKKTINIQYLFDFITNMNVLAALSVLPEENEETDEKQE